MSDAIVAIVLFVAGVEPNGLSLMHKITGRIFFLRATYHLMKTSDENSMKLGHKLCIRSILPTPRIHDAAGLPNTRAARLHAQARAHAPRMASLFRSLKKNGDRVSKDPEAAFIS
jgi:hypothetical protein